LRISAVSFGLTSSLIFFSALSHGFEVDRNTAPLMNAVLDQVLFEQSLPGLKESLSQNWHWISDIQWNDGNYAGE
jgi:hypothetical protein